MALALVASCIRLSDNDRRWPCTVDESECPEGQTCADASGFGACRDFGCQCLPVNYCNYNDSSGLPLQSCKEGEICSGQRCKAVDCAVDSDCHGWDDVEAICADGRCWMACDSDRICPSELECFADPRRSGEDLNGLCRAPCEGKSDCPDGFECQYGGACVIRCTPDEECPSCPDDECPNGSICTNNRKCE